MPHDTLVILEAARTPMAEYAGTPKFGRFASVSATELGALAARAALERSGVPPEDVDNVVFGNVIQSSPDAIYLARHIALKAGLPIETPAVTVNRLCGSGLQSIIDAARAILLGESRVALAGGTENMSQTPHALFGLRAGLRFGRPVPPLVDLLWEGLTDSYCQTPMAGTAQNLARRYEISRAAQDEFALRSHQLGARAAQEGVFAEEIVPVTYDAKRGEALAFDDHVKPDTTLAALGALPSPFGRDGTVTGGNASGIVDGAAALVLTTLRACEQHGWTPRARLVDWAVVGVEPDHMGIGPAPAIRALLARTKLALKDIDLFEINEAFAAQYLAVEKDLGLDRARTNVNGGAIALGHPLGMTCTRLVQTLIRELHRRQARRGIASACIGGGQGIAALLERC